MTLHEKVGKTAPGAYAQWISQLLYDVPRGLDCLDKKIVPKLQELFHFLENLAFDEVAKQAAEEGLWVRQFDAALAKRPTGPSALPAAAQESDGQKAKE